MYKTFPFSHKRPPQALSSTLEMLAMYSVSTAVTWAVPV